MTNDLLGLRGRAGFLLQYREPTVSFHSSPALNGRFSPPDLSHQKAESAAQLHDLFTRTFTLSSAASSFSSCWFAPASVIVIQSSVSRFRLRSGAYKTYRDMSHPEGKSIGSFPCF